MQTPRIFPLLAALAITAAPVLAAEKSKKNEFDTTPLSHLTQSKKLNDRMDQLRGQKSLELVTAGKYYSSYQANEVSADMKYKGKPFVLNGKIGAISKNAFGKIYLAFHGDTYGLKSVQAELFDEQLCATKDTATACSVEMKASQLKKGSGVFLDCFGKGMIANIPLATSCLVRP